jgi:zinc ribbon protein
MFCPNCGVETQRETKFCRSCGMDLKLVSQSFAGQTQIIGEQQAPKESQRRQAMKWGFVTFWGGILLAALLAIMGDAFIPISQRLGVFIGNLAPLGGLVTTVGIGIMLYSLFLPKAPSAKSPSAKSQKANPKLQSQTPAQLPPEPYRQPVGSVTESTTRLFDQPDSIGSIRDRARQRE